MTVVVGLPEPGMLQLTVHNVLGQTLASLWNGPVSNGYFRMALDGRNMASGVYFIHATVEGKLDQVKRVTLVR